MDEADLARRFAYHPPRSQQRVSQHEEVREHCWELAQHLLGLLPEGREKEHAIASLEMAQFWGNAALARADDPNATVSAEAAAAGPKTGPREFEPDPPPDW